MTNQQSNDHADTKVSDLKTKRSPATLKLITGLGNPGLKYIDTRHNAGVWFLKELARKFGASFKPDTKFHGDTSSIIVTGIEVRLLIPNTFMNNSGISVSSMANFFKIKPQEIMIAHDEIDFPAGKIRFKQDGGLAGHNGLRDISKRLAGETAFNRLRIGIGRPEDKGAMTKHVLGKVPKTERKTIEDSIQQAITALPLAISGDWQSAMQQLTRSNSEREEHEEH
mgnify:FL=1